MDQVYDEGNGAQDVEFLESQDVVDYTPRFSPQLRTAVYVAGVLVAFASFIVGGSAPVLMDDPTPVVTIAGLVGSGFGTLAAAFGVAYRPTK